MTPPIVHRNTSSDNQELLILVHPGSACGSADFTMGKISARSARSRLTSELNDWTSGLIVVDGTLSDELDDYPDFNVAITSALDRASSLGHPSGRIYACDDDQDDECPDWCAIVHDHVARLKLDPETRVTVSGAWYFPDDSVFGCVNGVHRAISTLGLTCEVSGCALLDR